MQLAACKLSPNAAKSTGEAVPFSVGSSISGEKVTITSRHDAASATNITNFRLDDIVVDLINNKSISIPHLIGHADLPIVNVDEDTPNEELIPACANTAEIKEFEVEDETGHLLNSSNYFLDKDTEVAWFNETKITLKANTSFSEIEKLGEEYMIHVNEISSKEESKHKVTSWLFEANITEHNKNISIQGSKAHAAYVKRQWFDLQTWKNFWPKFSNESLKRQFKLYSVLGVPALPEARYAEWASLKTQLQEIYSTATICDYHNPRKCDLSLDLDIAEILAKSRNYDELTHVWKAWRDATGKQMREHYLNFVDLGNEAAKINGFPSIVEMSNDPYELESFEKTIEDLYQQLKPLYVQLHAYARRKLREVYGEDKVSKSGPIPAHLFGNMWAQKWDRISDLLIPFPNKPSVDITDALIAQKYTPKLMFEKADNFFASLGLKRVNSIFWDKSIIEKPTDRKIICHAQAWDFMDGHDFRIKQCSKVNMEDFFTVHHELGHIQYYMQYSTLPTIFRDGANEGFHEAVGDTLSLSVNNPKHLHKVGLLDSYEIDYETDINFLMTSALKRVVFMPFAYVMDRWRWDVYRGLVSPENYTCSWWNYRYELQGVKPPIQRSSEDFDPGAKFHTTAGYRYIMYFISNILEFQFHKALCLLAGEYDPNDLQKPLHKCDIYQSTEAGTALSNMLKLGRSQHWTVPLMTLTGTEKMDISAMREYFRPLETWLIADNKKNGEFIGWKGDAGFC